MESNPYFAVSSGGPSSYHQLYSYGGGSRFQPSGLPVVRLRGLPFNCSEIDIYKFFAGLDIVDIFLVNKDGRFFGEAFVVFAGLLQVDYALQRDRQNTGRRYVEVFSCKKEDYYQAVAADVKEGGYDYEYPSKEVHIAYRSDGKATGEAYVELASAEEAKKAMCKDNMKIGSRYIELFPSHPDEARRAESRSRQ
ncbi:hypothetical protein K7X08_026865 [Anisodus acutangulus]|uniref:RRM domain-containing protein n=1 Tax=Anisodus acutangulus TaxID=402998 RepID=A0A9Q1QXU6_9SOLA|nr:hypothetical protein K7X08_026865 [Anisodus acutangulus]